MGAANRGLTVLFEGSWYSTSSMVTSDAASSLWSACKWQMRPFTCFDTWRYCADSCVRPISRPFMLRKFIRPWTYSSIRSTVCAVFYTRCCCASENTVFIHNGCIVILCSILCWLLFRWSRLSSAGESADFSDARDCISDLEPDLCNILRLICILF